MSPRATDCKVCRSEPLRWLSLSTSSLNWCGDANSSCSSEVWWQRFLLLGKKWVTPVCLEGKPTEKELAMLPKPCSHVEISSASLGAPHLDTGLPSTARGCSQKPTHTWLAGVTDRIKPGLYGKGCLWHWNHCRFISYAKAQWSVMPASAWDLNCVIGPYTSKCSPKWGPGL